MLLASQVIVVNYEDKHTTMEAPDDQDEISYRCRCHCFTCWCPMVVLGA